MEGGFGTMMAGDDCFWSLAGGLKPPGTQPAAQLWVGAQAGFWLPKIMNHEGSHI